MPQARRAASARDHFLRGAGAALRAGGFARRQKTHGRRVLQRQHAARLSLPGPMTAMRFVIQIVSRVAQAWRLIWFEPAPTTPLELARIGLGAALFCHYALATPHLVEFWGDAGWMPRKVLEGEVNDPLYQSLFFYFTAPWQLTTFHFVFLACCVALALGWRTSLVKWVVLIGQLSYANRSPMFVYGVDKI